MKRLIILRHAKTERTAASGDDFDRALTRRGLADAAAAGRKLAAAGLIPDLVLCSAAVRAGQTWEAAAPALPDANLERRPDLYNAPAEALRAVAEAQADATTVMVLAHNPGVEELARTLAQEAVLIDAVVQARLEQGFPTAAAIAFEIEPGRIGCLGLFLPGGAAPPP